MATNFPYSQLNIIVLFGRFFKWMDSELQSLYFYVHKDAADTTEVARKPGKLTISLPIVFCC